LIRELAALFLSTYYPLPDACSYRLEKEGARTYFAQYPMEGKIYTPDWCSGRFFLDRIVTLENGASIFLGALPHRVHAIWLGKQGCTTVISMIESKEYDVPCLFSDIVKPEEWGAFSMTHHQFSTPDFTPLSQDTLRLATDVAMQSLTSGKSIYVHCKAGRGRSSAVVAATLCKLFDKSVDEAVAILRKSRPQVTLDMDQQHPIRQLVSRS
jgi:atypical dual specificity phosphatase